VNTPLLPTGLLSVFDSRGYRGLVTGVPGPFDSLSEKKSDHQRALPIGSL